MRTSIFSRRYGERSIDEYIAKAGDWPNAAMKELDAILRGAAPKAAHPSSGEAPSTSKTDPLPTSSSGARHVTLGFWRGGELTDLDGALEGQGGRMEHVKIKQPADIDKRQFSAWVKQAIKLNSVEGDPSKRR